MTGTAGPLLEQIRSAAVAAAAEKISAARTGADAIRVAARAAAERRRTVVLAAHAGDAAAALSRARSETASRVGRDTLVARAAALDRIVEATNRLFTGLASHPGVRDALAVTIADALTYLPAGPATVRCAGFMEKPVREAVAGLKREEVTVQIDDAVPAGAVIEAADGSVAVDGTFARRLARERARISTELARRLLVTAP